MDSDIDRPTTKQLICNAPSLSFDEIKYKLCETEIYDLQHFEITKTIKNLVTASPEDFNWMQNAGWTLRDVVNHYDKSTFSFCIPLKLTC